MEEEVKKDYSKIRGWHIFFLITLFISFLQMIYSVYINLEPQGFVNREWFHIAIFSVFVCSFGCMVLLLTSILIFNKRNRQTLYRLKGHLVAIAFLIIVTTVVRMVLYATWVGEENVLYFQTETQTIVQAIAYSTIWFSYLTKSKRVAEYYN